MARIEDVAKRAGVSMGTVSNVLNRPEAVAPATRARVQAAMAALAYVPHGAARALGAGRSRTLGLVVPDVTNPFFADLARGAELVADRHDMVVMLYSSADSAERELRYLGQLEEQRVQGILVTPVDAAGATVQELVRRGTPVVLVDRAAGRRELCSVSVDNLTGGRLAAQHLIERGHRRIAFAGGPVTAPQVGERLAGARQIVGSAVQLVATTALTVAAGRAAGAALAAQPTGSRPTAVFCANDLLALGVLQAVTRAGLQVPADLAVVGYDDIEYAAAAAVPLTSVRQPRELLGEVAADLLFAEIDERDQHQHQQVVLMPELVVRESTV